ncbi:AraC family transcriptional regulator [Gorillibacterium sp. sgz5001074]|uniref:AraC family transcriptional regulator n=1 Tax=Gorillibacterium sp. sgz5001074 TaxID=3446695 RepID=UPI003F66B4C9
MKRTWYHRMLLSYLPIYLFISSVIILMTFLMISRMSQKEAENANRMFVEQQVEAVDRSLRAIDNMLIKELQFDDVIIKFFKNVNDPTFLLSYSVSEKINQLRSSDPLIDSIYLYRFSDRMVMTPNMLIPSDRFGDREFADGMRDNRSYYTLSEQRRYAEFPDQSNPVEVVSIVRQYPLLGEREGLLVVNVSLQKLQRWLEETAGSDRSYFYIQDKDGHKMAGINRSAGSSKGTEMSRVPSGYTGWIFIGGVLDGHLFQFASVLTYIWLICGFIIVGFLWIMFVTRRNYKPIETILDRIHHYSSQKSSKLTLEKDEFKFIDQALEALIERSQTYQKLHEEDMDIRRRQLFHDLTEGSRIMDREAWTAEASANRLPPGFGQTGFAIFEIDRYAAWTQAYNPKDQYLLKFVLSSVVKETADGRQAGVWSEWIANHRLAVVYFLQETGGETELHSLAEQVRGWVEGNLDFTVTVGLCANTGTIADLPDLRDEAVDALSYKGSVGINKVLLPPYRGGQGEPYKHLQNIRSFTQSFRLQEPKWKEQFTSMFEEIRQDLLNREEHVNLMNFLVYQLNKETSALSAEIVEKWSTVYLPRVSEAIEQYDLMEELQPRLRELFEGLEAEIQALRENRSNSVLARNIRRYIEQNHSNPDLSLNHLCDEFDLNGKYISRMFKEEFGEKLVDYMVHVRIEKSKELLTRTSLSVQEVAQSVGYLHDISFIRAFKKVVGQTPGEYRKQ